MRDSGFSNVLDLLVYAIGENPVGPCQLTSFDLSKNAITKLGAKQLGPALAVNTSLRSLDLSQCKLGVSGMYAICEALKTNKTIQSINLYRNIIDVDGARALGEVLASNTTLCDIDIGHNRIRQTGLKAVVDGITANGSSKLATLGIRSNFLNDDSFTHFFENLVFKGAKHQIKKLFIKANFLSEFHKVAIAQRVREEGVPVYVDDFEHVSNLNKNTLDRSIWCSPVPSLYINQEITTGMFFMETHNCGLVADVRIRSGKAVPGRTNENYYAIVEFAHENSVPRCLKVASKKLAVFGSLRSRIYKTGTRTAIILPRQKRR